MNDSQSRITFRDRIDDDADRKEVIDLVDGLILIDHLLIDREKVLDPASHLTVDLRVRHVLFDVLHDPVDEILPLGLSGIHLLDQSKVDRRFQISKGEVVHLGLYFGNTEPARDRRVDIHRLTCLLPLFLRPHELQCPQIVEAVSQLDQNNADILGHREEHLAQIFRLHLDLIDVVADLSQFRHAVHKELHLLAEFPADILVGQLGVLDDIMQKACSDRLLVQFQIRKDNGDTERMDDIGFA